MMENAIYSVISPEGCAAILYKDAGRAEEAAAALKLTAGDLLKLGLVDHVIPEPPGGAHSDHEEAASLLGDHLELALSRVEEMSPEDRREARYQKFRKMGGIALETVASG
jgi:acetyl-CoA carboxylase carboxyl transferase subunit alpha